MVAQEKVGFRFEGFENIGAMESKAETLQELVEVQQTRKALQSKVAVATSKIIELENSEEKLLARLQRYDLFVLAWDLLTYSPWTVNQGVGFAKQRTTFWPTFLRLFWAGLHHPQVMGCSHGIIYWL